MAVDFAAVELRLGARTAALLANATLTVGTTALDGVLDEVDVQPALGGAIFQGQRTQFICATAQLGAEVVAEGTAVAVDYRGQTRAYTVALRTDHEPIGQTVLDLRKAL